MDLAGNIFAARRSHSVHQTKLRTVFCDPGLAPASLRYERHSLSKVGARIRGEQIRRQPDKIDMTISRDEFVLHRQIPRTVIEPVSAPRPLTIPPLALLVRLSINEVPSPPGRRWRAARRMRVIRNHGEYWWKYEPPSPAHHPAPRPLSCGRGQAARLLRSFARAVTRG